MSGMARDRIQPITRRRPEVEPSNAPDVQIRRAGLVVA